MFAVFQSDELRSQNIIPANSLFCLKNDLIHGCIFIFYTYACICENAVNSARRMNISGAHIP